MRGAMARTGAQLLVEGLEAAGVEVVFGLPGVHNLAAWEALRESPIRLVVVRHEQAAVYAADGYARASGRLGVALVTTGPGAANAAGRHGPGCGPRRAVAVRAGDALGPAPGLRPPRRRVRPGRGAARLRGPPAHLGRGRRAR